MHEKHTTMIVNVMAKETFHHKGVLPSTIPAIVSESHPRLRRWATSGMRSNSAGVTGITGTSRISCSAIVSSFRCGFRISRMRARAVGWRGVAPRLMFVLLDVQRYFVIIGHLRIRIAHSGQVSQARPRIQKTEHAIIAILLLEL